MNIICKDRGMGKTHDIVKIACEKGYTIICLYRHQEQHLREEAERQGFDRTKLNVVIYNKNTTLDNSKTYLIDESEDFLTNILGVTVDTISINKENIVCQLDNDNISDIISDNISYLLNIYTQEIKKPNCDFGKAYNILKNIDTLRNQF